MLIGVLIGDGGRPQLAGYRGRGRLRSWLRSVGVRTARRLAGTPAAVDPDHELDQLGAAVDDPARELARARHGDQVRAAFAAALAARSERERNLLRQHHLDGLTVDQLGALYGVDRATAARWLVAARTAILDDTRARLAAELGATTTEIDRLIRLVRSQLVLSLRDLG